MARKGHNSDQFGGERLRQHIEVIEKLEDEKKEKAEAIKDRFKMAGSEGYRVRTMRRIINLRKMTKAQRQEDQAMEQLYLYTLGEIEQLDQDAIERLDKTMREERPEPPTETHASSPPPPDEKPAEIIIPPPIEETADEAQAKGRVAALAGKSVLENPYPAFHKLRRAWEKGWFEESKPIVDAALKQDEKKADDAEPGTEADADADEDDGKGTGKGGGGDSHDQQPGASP